MSSVNSCGKCNKVAGISAPTISCSGFCDSFFHYDCAPVDRSSVNAITKNPNVLWWCNNCMVVLASITKKGDAVVQNCIAQHFLRLEQEIASNRKIIQDLHHDIGQRLYVAPLPTLPQDSSLTNYKDASVIINNGQDSPPKPSNGLPSQIVESGVVIGSAAADSDSLGTISAVIPKKWLFVSRISSSTTDDQFKNYVERKFQIPGSSCHRIEPRRSNDLFVKDYVSYKIAVDASLLDSLLLPSSWPVNILVKEYVIRRGNFRQRNLARFRD